MRLLETPTIQMRGFRNVRSGADVVGFQFAVRLPYYRGIWLSQLRPAVATVDGIEYRDRQIAWTIGGVTYEQDRLAEHPDVHWSITEPAVLTVRKPGGLAPGFHDIEVLIRFSASYLPPRLDLDFFSGTARRRLVLVR
ncbi:MAG: DUF6379 domain-containing protein [Steroidobacteraceae bacterium]|nr:DUF6379 domain-containing protein [Steroidobacteraceae bacterium]MDW8259413.1 DUF6379 domain-containing protein [Gammaproteobacteria bacterium]